MQLRIFLIMVCMLCLSSVTGACEQNVEIQSAAKRLGSARTLDEGMTYFRIFETKPDVAVCYLITGLHKIHQTRIDLDSTDNAAWESVWSIRALRYLTGGLDFFGTTKTKFNVDDKVRETMLTRKGKNAIPFFRHWPSRDLIFVAPEDTQTEIIQQWDEWLERDAKNFKYIKADSLDSWYF